MLVLTRKPGERILIGDDVEVTLLSVRGDQARIGITAPPSVSICRREVLERVRQENIAAARNCAAGDPVVSPPPHVILSGVRDLPPARSHAAHDPAGLIPRQALKPTAAPADTTNSGAPARQSHKTIECQTSSRPERRHARR
jgi:carbon storage regulator